MRIGRLLCGAALSLALGTAAQANLLVNGSFEDATGFTPDGNNTMSLSGGATTMTGWTVLGDTIAWIQDPNPFGGITANDGIFFLDLTGYPNGPPFGGVSQSFASLVGATYELTFDLGSAPGGGLPVAIQASAGNASQIFTNTIATGNNNWETVTLSFMATSTNTLVSLLGTQGNSYIGLDNVSVVLVREPDPGPGPIPEPGTWALMISGFGLAGATLRRRRQGALA